MTGQALLRLFYGLFAKKEQKVPFTILGRLTFANRSSAYDVTQLLN